MKNIVIIIPPKPLYQKLEDLMKEFNLIYHTKKALLYKPHITLKSLGDVENKNLKDVMIGISGIIGTIKPLSVDMHGLRFYGSRKYINGIYIPVERSYELLSLHRRLVHKLRRYGDSKDRSYKELENFNPHLTLVGNDIDTKNLGKAKRELKDVIYSYNFSADKITLELYTEEGNTLVHPWYMDFMLSS